MSEREKEREGGERERGEREGGERGGERERNVKAYREIEQLSQRDKFLVLTVNKRVSNECESEREGERKRKRGRDGDS